MYKTKLVILALVIDDVRYLMIKIESGRRERR
jgi:hypothetical protein